MLILLKENDPILLEKSEPWDFIIDEDPNDLIRDMIKVMFENNGIGLSAIQCGIKKRIFIMGNEQNLVACINPEIVESTGEIRDNEGCLSFPNLWLLVNRAEKIKVKYQTIRAETVERELDGLMARVFQHEYDHLDGICFISKVGPVALDRAKEKRKKKSRHFFNKGN
jgi:peptide deformylase